jgi:hypothetical protein
MVPVSMRGPQPTALGNHVSAIFLDLPIDSDSLGSALDEITQQKDSLRKAHAPAGSSLLVDVAALLPAPLHTAVLRAASGTRFANLVLSDIPGPNQTLYLLGHRVLACYPMMPLAPNVGLSIAAVRMGGVIGIGVTADPSLVPNVQQLANAIETAWRTFTRPRQPRVARHRAA